MNALVHMSAPLGEKGENSLVLTPVILDFLLDVAREQRKDKGPPVTSRPNAVDGETGVGLVTQLALDETTISSEEFPVNLTVRFHMEVRSIFGFTAHSIAQSSAITFSGRPAAELEAQVVLPAIDMVISTHTSPEGAETVQVHH